MNTLLTYRARILRTNKIISVPSNSARAVISHVKAVINSARKEAISLARAAIAPKARVSRVAISLVKADISNVPKVRSNKADISNVKEIIVSRGKIVRAAISRARELTSNVRTARAVISHVSKVKAGEATIVRKAKVDTNSVLRASREVTNSVEESSGSRIRAFSPNVARALSLVPSVSNMRLLYPIQTSKFALTSS